MIAYRKTNGRAHDLRCVPDDYEAEDGEILLELYELPAIETLHDPVPPELERRAAIDKQIASLEAMITQRMLREAIEGKPPAAYTSICAQIESLRSTRP